MLWRLAGSVALFADGETQEARRRRLAVCRTVACRCVAIVVLFYFMMIRPAAARAGPAAGDARRREEERPRRHHRRRLRRGLQCQPRGRRSDASKSTRARTRNSASRSVRSAASWATNRRTTPPRNRPLSQDATDLFVGRHREPTVMPWYVNSLFGQAAAAERDAPSLWPINLLVAVGVLAVSFFLGSLPGQEAPHARSRLEDRRDPLQPVGQRRHLVARDRR